ncbi:hypothetical protein AVEN_86954-1 [Araneus ventricosus]|uniref:Uncharacterized protein n=1 Tax=Araneus ventricosus TaxID=182803 RepID=A0A4Y2NDW8_ARAVE|nr:hypothetical protein AVEN_50984-1 [Araneus ventricosus]GBN36062.1 hypothetical protein AVEN_86954-1 [Araneus ventricosus]
MLNRSFQLILTLTAFRDNHTIRSVVIQLNKLNRGSIHNRFHVCLEGRGGLVARPRPRDRRSQARSPIPLKIRRVWGLLHAKSYVVAKRPPVGVAQKLGERVPAQVSFSSSDRGSKLRAPSLNSPRVASKHDVNLT